MSGGQEKILKYLVERYPKWVTATSVGEEINGKGAAWATPLLTKLVVKGLVEKDALGRFRVVSNQLPTDSRLP